MAQTKKSIEEIFELKTEDFTYFDKIGTEGTQYYDAIKNKFELMLSDDKNYDIIAPTGSGKTYAIINFAKAFKKKFMLFTPYVANVRENERKYDLLTNYKIMNVSNSFSDIQHLVSTYNGIAIVKLRDFLDLSEYILIIDEFHNFFVQLGFRNKAIQEIHYAMDKFKKVITLTGTPEGIYNNTNPIVKFIPETPRPKQHFTTILTGKDLEFKLINHINEKRYDGKIIIFYNNSDLLKSIRRSLIDLGYDSSSIEVVTAQDKKSTIYKSITEKSKIPDQTKFMLCTSVFSDGINIDNTDISAVYFCNEDNLITLRQFYRRFRFYQGPIFDLLIGKDATLGKKTWPDFYPNISNSVKELEVISEYLQKQVVNRLNSKECMDEYFCKSFLKEFDEFRFLYYNEELSVINPNIYRVLYDRLLYFFNIAFYNMTNRKEYLEAFEELEFTEFIDLRNDDLGNQQSTTKERNVYNSIINLIKSNVAYALKASSLVSKQGKININRIKALDFKNYVESNNVIIQSEIFNKVCKRVLLLESLLFLDPQIILQVFFNMTPAKKRDFLNKLRFFTINNYLVAGVDHPFFDENDKSIYFALRQYVRSNNPVTKERFENEIIQ
ncbi:MAG: DEAD/DEAH box helicase family protein, partial [Ignavibacteriae bacterium]|nr:DEAD/DEAH box helicase family protein [Ignavibacteriota bacterium]